MELPPRHTTPIEEEGNSITESDDNDEEDESEDEYLIQYKSSNA